MTTINLGGVPEYFNLPIHTAIKEKAFEKEGIDLIWHTISQGTGAMARQLQEGDLDLAIILTEGITKSIIDGNPSRIVKTYVASPLTWGIHMPYSEKQQKPNIDQDIFGISRYGSGSHLMAFVLAQREGWPLENLKFEIVNNMDGARASFKNGTSNIFLWEKFTTKFLVEKKEFSRVDELPTPWPCFVIAASQKALSEKEKEIAKVCEIINQYCERLKNDPNLAQLIAQEFDLQIDDSEAIIEKLKWSNDLSIDEEAINRVKETFLTLGMIEKDIPNEKIIHQLALK